MAYPSLSRAIEGVHLRLLMNKSEIINGYWIGLQRAIGPAKHLHNFYKEIFNQPFHKQNLTAMYGLVDEYGKDIVYKLLLFSLSSYKGVMKTA